jgi:hypothetical protein
MDGIFAIVILLTGYLIISSNRSLGSTEAPLGSTLQNGVDLLSTIKIKEICSLNCDCRNRQLKQLCIEGKIADFDQTLLNYFGELYTTSTYPNQFRTDMNRSTLLFKNLTLENNIFREELFGIEFKIINKSNEIIVYRSLADETQDSRQKSKNLISSKTVVFGSYVINSTGEVYFWGPYLAEVELWEK